MQLVAPVDDWKVPVAQLTQLVALDFAWYSPAEQLEHNDAPEAEYAPATQFAQLRDPVPCCILPALQLIH